VRIQELLNSAGCSLLSKALSVMIAVAKFMSDRISYPRSRSAAFNTVTAAAKGKLLQCGYAQFSKITAYTRTQEAGTTRNIKRKIPSNDLQAVELMQDIDRILAELAAHAAAAGLALETVREVLLANMLGEQPLPIDFRGKPPPEPKAAPVRVIAE